MIFDGNTLTLAGKNVNLFTQIGVPGSVDNLVDELQNTYGRALPASALILSNAYDKLTRGVVNVKDLGSGVIGGTECDYLAFRTKDLDWEIWIAQGDRPYPCKYVLTSKGIEKEPQYTVQIRDWKTGTDVASDDFAFNNSTNAVQIDPQDLKTKMSELPENFKRRNN